MAYDNYPSCRLYTQVAGSQVFPIPLQFIRATDFMHPFYFVYMPSSGQSEDLTFLYIPVCEAGTIFVRSLLYRLTYICSFLYI